MLESYTEKVKRVNDNASPQHPDEMPFCERGALGFSVAFVVALPHNPEP
jgi:hypothetical protein